MRRPATALICLALSASGKAAEPKCSSYFGPIVPDAMTARTIAVAVIRAHQRPEKRMQYELKIGRDPNGNWSAFQGLRPARDRRGNIVVTEGGGGFSMTIDRCAGTVSDLILQK